MNRVQRPSNKLFLFSLMVMEQVERLGTNLLRCTRSKLVGFAPFQIVTVVETSRTESCMNWDRVGNRTDRINI